MKAEMKNMVKYILKHWKKNPMVFFIIVSGYVITILAISMLISDIQNKILTYSQSNFGKSGERSAVFLFSDVEKNYNYNTIDILKYLGKFGEINVLKIGTEVFKSGTKTVQGEITPYYFEKQSNWEPMIYKGRHLTAQECMDNSKSVVIGYKIAQDLGVNVNDKINFYGSNYTVVGIMGKKNLSTNFDKAVYIPIGALPKEYLSNFEQKVTSSNGENCSLKIYLLFRVNDSALKGDLSNLTKKFGKNTFHYEISQDVNLHEDFSDIMINIVLICLPLLIVALVNVINISIYWVSSRKKEISIKKVIGANDKFIRKSIEKDMIFVAIVSAIVSMLVQFILYLKLEPIVNNYGFSFNLTWLNFIIALIVSYGVGYLASIIPVEKSLDMNPADALKIE